jgi:hypothetical protein
MSTKNRTVLSARRAITDFVESNAPRLNGWLERVAEGTPKRGQDGKKILDNDGSVVWIVKPDPATAMKLVSDLCEYHLPKLSRAEVDIRSVAHQLNNLTPQAQAMLEMSPESLLAHLTAIPEAVPEWLRPSPNTIEGEVTYEPQPDR